MDKPAICPGCGAVLQTAKPEEPGFLPAGLLERPGVEPLCRRCYRIRHYNVAEPTPLSGRSLLSAVAAGVAEGEGALFLVDPFDFEGTWRPEWVPLFGKRPYYLVLNKIDLLPSVSKEPEVIAWARKRVGNVRPLPQGILSSGTRRPKDLAALRAVLERNRWSSVTLVGATNVGKSSLLGVMAGAGGILPTVSHFPGTTQGVVTVRPAEGPVFLDTPGLTPGDRFSEAVCPSCGARLTPAKRLQAKLFHVLPGQGVLFANAAFFELRSDTPGTFLCYAGDEVTFHRTTGEKGRALLGQSTDWLNGLCANCAVSLEWKRHEVRLKSGQDLAIAGLGWVSLRGGDATIAVWLPEGVLLKARPGLFGQRKAFPAQLRSSRGFHRS